MDWDPPVLPDIDPPETAIRFRNSGIRETYYQNSAKETFICKFNNLNPKKIYIYYTGKVRASYLDIGSLL